MIQIIKLGEEPNALEITTKVSLRAKRISIRISPNNEVELVLPDASDFNKAYLFLLEKELWIRNKLRKLKAPSPKAAIPKKLSIFGQEHELILQNHSINQPIKIVNNQIIVSHVIADSVISDIIELHFRKLIKIEIEKYATLKARELKVKYSRITIRDTTSRWGSCSSSGALSFSWRLILAPRSVMEYVVVHELCHLIEMNHSHKFWSLVAQIYPEHKTARLWLKKHGRILHQII